MAWNNGNSGGYGNQQGYGNNGGGNGGGQRGGRVSFAKGSASLNKQPKGDRSRHFGGTLQINGGKRWLSVWINGPRENPNAQGAIQHLLGIIASEQLYLTIDVGDIAPEQQNGQGQGNQQGGGYQQNGGGYGNQQAAPQQGQNGFQFQGGNNQNGGSGYQGQGGFRR